jgi:hypothetical protein
MSPEKPNEPSNVTSEPARLPDSGEQEWITAAPNLKV